MPIRPKDYEARNLNQKPAQERLKWVQLAERLWERSERLGGMFLVGRQAHMADGIWWKVEVVAQGGGRRRVMQWTRNAEEFGEKWASARSELLEAP